MRTDHRSQVTGHNAHATSALFFYRDTRRLIRRCANMLRMLHGPRQRGTAHDTRKGHCTTTSWHRAREADLHGGPRMHDRMGDWMNRMEFLEPWRRIYAGPRVRSAHPVLHSRPAFACMAGSSESCTHSPEGNTPVAAVAATGCAPRGSGWSRGHDDSAPPEGPVAALHAEG